MRIRAGRESDWRNVARGNAEAAWLTFAPRAAGVSASLFKLRARRFEARLRDDRARRRALFVAEDERGYAGHIWVEERGDPWLLENYAVVLTLFVARRARRCGVGRRLLRRAYHWGKRLGHRRIHISVAPHNRAALALYAGEGFQTMLLSQVRRLA